MNIFKEAKQNKLKKLGYKATRFVIVWKNENVSWNWSAFKYGIRWSDKLQFFPIKNVSNNSQRSLMFGFLKLYFQVILHRRTSFNQSRKLILRKKLWKFYQLVS